MLLEFCINFKYKFCWVVDYMLYCIVGKYMISRYPFVTRVVVTCTCTEWQLESPSHTYLSTFKVIKWRNTHPSYHVIVFVYIVLIITGNYSKLSRIITLIQPLHRTERYYSTKFPGNILKCNCLRYGFQQNMLGSTNLI